VSADRSAKSLGIRTDKSADHQQSQAMARWAFIDPDPATSPRTGLLAWNKLRLPVMPNGMLASGAFPLFIRLSHRGMQQPIAYAKAFTLP